MWYTYYSFFVKFFDLIMIAQGIYWIFNQMLWQWKCTLVMQYLLTHMTKSLYAVWNGGETSTRDESTAAMDFKKSLGYSSYT